MSNPLNLHNSESIIRKLLPLALLSILLFLSYKIVAFFITPVVWAAIIAYVTWPLYTKLNARLKNRVNVSAFIMSGSITLIIGVPLIVGIILLQQEAFALYDNVLTSIQSGFIQLPTQILELPVLGAYIAEQVNTINLNPEATLQSIRDWLQNHLSYGKEIVDVIVKILARLGIAMMMLFFFYRDGRELLKQIRIASHLVLGDRVNGYFSAMGMTTQAVVYGIGLTAIAQAVLAGIGYFFANAPSPILLTILTMLIALIPFGTPFAWGGVVLYLLSQGQTAEAVGLAIWCMLVVSWVDNIIRPIVISGATKIPFMIILIGVLGGISAFGFIGLFIGPVVLAVALAVWREWISQQIDETIEMKAITAEQLLEADKRVRQPQAEAQQHKENKEQATNQSVQLANQDQEKE